MLGRRDQTTIKKLCVGLLGQRKNDCIRQLTAYLKIGQSRLLVPVLSDLCITVIRRQFIRQNGCLFVMPQCFCNNFHLTSSLFNNFIA